MPFRGPENQNPPGGRPEGGWQWRDAGSGTLRSPFLLFLPDGRIGGGAATQLGGWRRDRARLILASQDGQEWPLWAEGSGWGNAELALHPAGAWPLRPLPPLRSGRRNLVVLRAGDASLHPLWLESMGGQPRSWDLCLSYYGSHPEDWRDQPEYFVAQAGAKYPGLAPLLDEDWVWTYDYIWFPDDDLLIDGAAINQMFALARQHDLWIAQPSLAAGCFINHRITGQIADFKLRFTSFVEIMAPLFARPALAVVAPSFGLNQSGYGLDHLWPALLGSPQNRVAILDEIAMVHTRPMGANYDIEGAASQGWEVLERFGLRQLYAQYGGLWNKPAGWSRVRGDIGRPLRQPAAEAALALS